MTTRTSLPIRHCFVPPYLQRALEHSHWLLVDERFRTRRTLGVPGTLLAVAGAAGAAWTIHTAANTATLPGTAVRAAGEPESGDVAADEAASGVAGALAMYDEVYARDSYDAQGAPVSITVHYETDYDNAFWDGSQLIFGDGDGKVFGRFTAAVDVLGHELTHAVTQFSAGLTYQGQSGALNESVSDVFGSCLKQRLLGQDAADADWLIGAGIFVPGIEARGLRDMKTPGTAYDDPQLGKDPQPADMSGYVETTDDNGGVHLNSGIPNRAFQLAAVGIGGSAAEGAGRVWYAALTNGSVTADTDFAGFARATVAAASQDQRDAVRTAWETVGVLTAAAPAPVSSAPASPVPLAGSPVTAGPGVLHPRPVSLAPAPQPHDPAGPRAGSAAELVRVRRTGGIAGLTTAAEIDLADPAVAEDERTTELRSLLTRSDLMADLDPRRIGSPPEPDRYVYAFDLGGRSFTVPEQHLTADLRRVAHLVLSPDS